MDYSKKELIEGLLDILKMHFDSEMEENASVSTNLRIGEHQCRHVFWSMRSSADKKEAMYRLKVKMGGY